MFECLLLERAEQRLKLSSADLGARSPPHVRRLRRAAQDLTWHPHTAEPARRFTY